LLPQQEQINVDETGDKDNGERMWTWCFRAAMFTLFKISPSRGSQVLLEVLGAEFDGTIGCDYHYRGSDYALYMHPDGRFYPMFRDNNESFSYGGGPGGFGRRDPFQRTERSLKLDPLVHAGEERAALCHALLSVPAWKSQYLKNCHTIASEWLDWTKIGALVDAWKKQIEPMIEVDDKALYGHEAFVVGLNAGTERRPGLKSFCEERRAFLADYAALKMEN
jgi:hypothetical protein